MYDYCAVHPSLESNSLVSYGCRQNSLVKRTFSDDWASEKGILLLKTCFSVASALASVSQVLSREWDKGRVESGKRYVGCAVFQRAVFRKRYVAFVGMLSRYQMGTI